MPESPFSAPSDSFQRQQPDIVSHFCHLMSYYALQVSFEKIYYALAEKIYRKVLGTTGGKAFYIRSEILGKNVE